MPTEDITASALLARGRYAELIESLAERGDAGGSETTPLERAARGALASLEGRFDEATQCFEAALALGGIEPLRPVARRFVRQRRPGHWFLPPIKRALVSTFGPADGAAVFADLAGRPAGWRIASLRLTSLHDHALVAAARYEELAPSTTVSLPALRVFGSGHQPRLEGRTRTVFHAVLDDAVVSGKSDLVLTEREALLDYQRDELGKVPLDLDVDPVVVEAGSEEVSLVVDAGASESEALDVAMPLVGVQTYNFGHWLMQFLPRVLACQDRPGFADVVLLIDRQMPPQHVEALRWLVGANHPVRALGLGEAVRVRRLWTCSNPVYTPLFPQRGSSAARDLMVVDGQAFGGLLARAGARSDGAVAGSARRIFLARKSSQHRAMVNKREVEEWFAARGFEIHDFGELGFGEQLALVRGADVIVGPSGSSLMMTFFAGPGTRIGILNNPFLQDHEWYAAVAAGLGQRLSVLTGPVVADDQYYDYRAAYTIDVDGLGPFLEDLAHT
jgi:hypothetical protein